MPPKLATLGLICFALIVGAAGCTDTADDTTESATSTEPKRASADAEIRAKINEARVTRLVRDKLGVTTEYDATRVRDVKCKGQRSCTINYNADTPFSRGELNTLEDQRPIWKSLFANPKFQRAEMTAWGEIVTRGGKESIGPLLRITCDRADNDEIDWDNIDVHGMKDICEYAALVKLA